MTEFEVAEALDMVTQQIRKYRQKWDLLAGVHSASDSFIVGMLQIEDRLATLTEMLNGEQRIGEARRAESLMKQMRYCRACFLEVPSPDLIITDGGAPPTWN